MSIDEAVMPEREPDIVKQMREGTAICDAWRGNIVAHIDALKLHAQQSAEAASKETKRADAWVKAARDLARELGVEDDDSNGSIHDWRHIRSVLKMRLDRLREVEARTVERCAKVLDERCQYYGGADAKNTPTIGNALFWAAAAIRALPIGHAEDK